jgi:Holliday junction DNA helicase RuvA
MIAQLTGQIAYRGIDHLILDVNGVGYRVTVPLSTFYALPEQGSATLQIHTHVKEDAFHLFGFLSLAEKEMFALLIGVSGVGPKLAVNILSNIPTDELAAALADGNIARLSSIPGIGKKTAERLVVDLRDKASASRRESAAGKPVSTSGHSFRLEDALSALTNLGYKESQARKVIDSIEISPESSVEEILKGALRLLIK